MKTSDFYYELPPECIAQTPLERRDASRMMVLDRQNGAFVHKHFYDLPAYLRAGDCLVLNDSKVLPARLLGHRDSGAAVEVLLLHDRGGGDWECLTKPGKRTGLGSRLLFGSGELQGQVVSLLSGGRRLIHFDYDGIFLEILERLGRMPLPPYIKAQLDEPDRYQTVYARESGSAAAPTAGLHFTPALLEQLKSAGVDIEYVTLHVGLGTFRPVKEENVEAHEMHAEFCTVSPKTADAVNRAKAEGRRVIACGTTSCRTLEAVAAADGTLRPFADWVNIYIYPGYTFKCIDGLITNFHLPESTLIMLVSAYAGREHVLRAYKAAVESGYRFFSFGDAMLIV